MKRLLLILLVLGCVGSWAAEGFYSGHTASAFDNAGFVAFLGVVAVAFLFPADRR